ncbi:MAG: thiamine ABC transporter permease [Firmicutes bacterium HGW-Firmicutes-9]|jgi:ATP-binding cassette subfamily B protein|nr:MAG: thiamine ABC transporter permease [Firmicutes bacterium HGW-Firmicutes-9]
MSKLQRFIAYYRPHKGLLILDLSCAVFVSLIDIAYPMLTQYILRTLLPQMAIDSAMVRTFVSLIVIAFGAYVVRAVLLYIINYWGHVLGVRMEADIRRDIFSHIQELSFSFFDKVRTGKLMSRLTTDLFDITELAHHGPEDVLISGTTVIGAFIVMMFVDWRLALALLCIVPVAIYYVIRLRIKMRDASLKVKERVAEINADIESSISGARVAKAFTNEDHERKKFEHGNAKFVHAKDGFYRYMALFGSGMEFFVAMFNLVVLALGGYLIYKSSLDPILLVTFSLYIAAFIQPIKRLAAFAEVYILGMAGFSRFCEIMDVEPEIKDRPNAVSLENVRGDICFDDVTFAYQSGKSVLSHVNLDIPAGRTLALVGPSGGGKTTLCHLIPRFYEQRSGTITIDGVDTRDVTLRSLRKNVGIVQQDVFLFASTIMENIRYGRIDATDEEVVAAAKRAHIHEEIMQFSDGYDTQVGERGIMLSGGQKQRVSIARLFLKNPPVLILDEATSALDTVTEHDIQQSFEELSRGRTTLVIAHRLSTVKNADEIVVLDEQGVRERGTHEELLQANGLYAKLYHASMIQ